MRQHVPRLLWLGVRRELWLQVDAAIEQLIPPLSVPFALGVVAISAALVAGSAAAGGSSRPLPGRLRAVPAGRAGAGPRAAARSTSTLGSRPSTSSWKVGAVRALAGGPRAITAWVRRRALASRSDATPRPDPDTGATKIVTLG